MKYPPSDPPSPPSMDGKPKSPNPGSASIQSHPSIVVSRARLRNPSTTTFNFDDTPPSSSDQNDLEANGFASAFLPGQPHWIESVWSFESPYLNSLRPGRYRFLKLFLVLYSCFSVLVFTGSLWNNLLGGLTSSIQRDVSGSDSGESYATTLLGVL